MSSRLLRIMPEHTFDVHVLRTFKRDLIALLTQLQASLPRPSEAINQVIFILNQTFRDVELSYLVWRHERVQTTLQHGFQYSRARVKAAIWRRDQGRPATAFPGLFNAFNPTGASPSPPTNNPSNWPTDVYPYRGGHQQGGMNYQANPYGHTLSTADTWSYPVQNTPGRSSGELPAQSPVGSPTGYTPYPAMSASPGGSGHGHQEYRAQPHQVYSPPPFPPPDWRPPSPVPGTAPVTTEVSRAVEVAISYLEAVNKAVNLCIDANAM